MVIKDGLAYCLYCYEGFDLGHHFEFHISQCRAKKREYTRMNPKDKEAVVNAVEAAFREYKPGTLIGFGEI